MPANRYRCCGVFLIKKKKKEKERKMNHVTQDYCSSFKTKSELEYISTTFPLARILV